VSISDPPITQELYSRYTGRPASPHPPSTLPSLWRQGARDERRTLVRIPASSRLRAREFLGEVWATAFSQGQFATLPMSSGAQRTPQQRRSVLVPCIIGPLRRSHIFAVVSGMMVVSGDVAINGRASASSGESRAYPPWTTRSRASVPDTVPVCSASKMSLPPDAGRLLR
jgi:hypothetical protein